MSDPNKDRERIRDIMDRWLEPPADEEDEWMDAPLCEKCGFKICDH